MHRCDKHKHKQKIRNIGAKVSNFDDIAVGAKEFITGIPVQNQIVMGKTGFRDEYHGFDSCGYACLMPIYK